MILSCCLVTRQNIYLTLCVYFQTTLLTSMLIELLCSFYDILVFCNHTYFLCVDIVTICMFVFYIVCQVSSSCAAPWALLSCYPGIRLARLRKTTGKPQSGYLLIVVGLR
jgi:hypothetical protein